MIDSAEIERLKQDILARTQQQLADIENFAQQHGIPSLPPYLNPMSPLGSSPVIKSPPSEMTKRTESLYKYIKENLHAT